MARTKKKETFQTIFFNLKKERITLKMSINVKTKTIPKIFISLISFK